MREVDDMISEGSPVLPSEELLYGIDVSHWQGKVDWAKVKAAGVSFAFAKVSEGVHYADDQWPGNRGGMLALGDQFIAGAYHFLRADADIKAQVEHFLSRVGDVTNLAVALDVERRAGVTKQATAAQAAEWVAEFKRHTNDHPVIGYYPHWYWNESGRGDLSFFDQLWASHYVSGSGSADSLYAKVPDSWWAGYGGESVVILQFTASGKVAGVTGSVDIDAFRGSLTGLRTVTLGRSMTEPLPPETANGPTEADEERVLKDLYGQADEDGTYRGLAAAIAPTGASGLLAEARRSLGLGEPNGIQTWYKNRNGSAFAYNFPWCEASLTYWAYHSGNYAEVCPKGDRAYTVYGAQDGVNLGRWYAGTVENIKAHCKPGAKIYFDWAGSNAVGAVDHVGVVEAVLSDGRVQTIEGNTANVCARRVRSAGDIAGFWNPAYKSAPAPPPAPTPAPVPAPNWTEKLVKTLPTLKRGATGAAVKRAQHLLLAAGQKLPRYGADSDFGAETQAAVKAFQKSKGLSQTGVVAQAEYTKLLGV